MTPITCWNCGHNYAPTEEKCPHCGKYASEEPGYGLTDEQKGIIASLRTVTELDAERGRQTEIVYPKSSNESWKDIYARFSSETDVNDMIPYNQWLEDHYKAPIRK